MVAMDASTLVHLVLVAVAQELLAKPSPPKALVFKADWAASDTSTLSLVFTMAAVGLAATETKVTGAVRTPWHLAGWAGAVPALSIPL